MLETDSQNIKEALVSDVSDIQKWVDELSVGQLKEVLILINSGKGISDQTIRKLAIYHSTFIKIEAWGCFKLVIRLCVIRLSHSVKSVVLMGLE